MVEKSPSYFPSGLLDDVCRAGVIFALFSFVDYTIYCDRVYKNSLEMKVEDVTGDGRLDLPSSLDRSRDYTLSFDEKGNAYLRYK